MVGAQAIATLIHRNLFRRTIAVTAVFGRRCSEANGTILAKPKVWTMGGLVHRDPFTGSCHADSSWTAYLPGWAQLSPRRSHQEQSACVSARQLVVYGSVRSA